MRVSAYSDPAIEDGDNEDWVSAAPGLIVVVDGAHRNRVQSRGSVVRNAARFGFVYVGQQ